MAYEGDELRFCPADLFDFDNASAVIVSGDWPNSFGHMLFCTGVRSQAIYFQVAGVYTAPRYMNSFGYILEKRRRESFVDTL